MTPYPVWWSWFGPDYTRLVQHHLPAEQVEQVEQVNGSLFHARSELPANRDDLCGQLPASTTWLPTGLLATPQPLTHGHPVPELTPATKIPTTLVAKLE